MLPGLRRTARNGLKVKDEGLIANITAMCDKAAAASNVELVEVELRGSGKARLLRVYIDKPGGVTHGDCENVSELVGALLDEADALADDSYTLEVSSPGVERKLTKPRDFERVIGQKVRVSLREPVDARKLLEGKLAAFADDTLSVETAPGTVLAVPLRLVQKANLKFDW
jgi:ribosome maturation factor RimP